MTKGQKCTWCDGRYCDDSRVRSDVEANTVRHINKYTVFTILIQILNGIIQNFARKYFSLELPVVIVS